MLELIVWLKQKKRKKYDFRTVIRLGSSNGVGRGFSKLKPNTPQKLSNESDHRWCDEKKDVHRSQMCLKNELDEMVKFHRIRLTDDMRMNLP